MKNALRKHARVRSSGVALAVGGTRMSYRELYERVRATGDWLKEAEIASVAIDLPNSMDWVIADLACDYAGVVTVPVPQFFTADQKEHAYRMANVDFAVSDRGATVPGLFQARIRMTGETLARATPVKVTFTSGSTGSPKGVVLWNETLVDVASSIVEAMDLIDVRKHLCLLPLATLLENVAGVYAPLLKGIEVAIPKDAGLKGSSGLDIEQFAQCLEAEKPDSIILVPQLLMALVTLTELGVVNPSYLKMVAVGGGKVSTELLEKSERVGIPVYEGYGLSEAGSVVTLNLPGAASPGAAGRPLPHARVRVSAAGEIEVAGSLMKGYLGKKDRTGDWLRTGDIGYIDDDGYLHIKGRSKNVFVTAFGRNVNPEWVEAEIGLYPEISQVLVYGEAMSHNLALVWPRFSLGKDEVARIIGEANERLPDYARVGEHVIVEQPMPTELITANGRLKRSAVIERFRDLIDNHRTSSAV